MNKKKEKSGNSTIEDLLKNIDIQNKALKKIVKKLAKSANKRNNNY